MDRWFSVWINIKFNIFVTFLFLCSLCTCKYPWRIILNSRWIMNFSVLVFWVLCSPYPAFCLPWPGMAYCLDFLQEWVRGSHPLLPRWLQGSFLVSFTNKGFSIIGLKRAVRVHGLKEGSACCACKLKTKSWMNWYMSIGINILQLWWWWNAKFTLSQSLGILSFYCVNHSGI